MCLNLSIKRSNCAAACVRRCPFIGRYGINDKLFNRCNVNFTTKIAHRNTEINKKTLTFRNLYVILSIHSEQSAYDRFHRQKCATTIEILFSVWIITIHFHIFFSIFFFNFLHFLFVHSIWGAVLMVNALPKSPLKRIEVTKSFFNKKYSVAFNELMI